MAGPDAASASKITIAFIGAKSVGKTSIIRQFVSNEFSDEASPTAHPQRYTTSLVTNNRIVEIHISDFPAIDKFPEDSIQEWNMQCDSSTGRQRRGGSPPASFCRLRQASAYVLVFDSSRPAATFQYIRQIRDQILAYGGKDVYKKPMVVAANKQDLVVKPAHHRSSHPVAGRQRRAPSFLHHHHVGGGGGHHHPAPSSSNGAGKNGAATSATEWSCTVRKQWRCLYVECSAKFNWQMVHLFQQVVSAVESSANGDGNRTSGGDPSRHQLPHSIAQLVHLGQLAHLGSFNVPGVPAVPGVPLPPPPPPAARSKSSGSTPDRLRGSSDRSGLQCPVS